MFPLNLFPLPGETIALHIFEERYQVLFEQLETMEVDEFGIPFVDGTDRKTLGGVMRLVFASEPDENGFRDAAVQCVGLFQLESFEASGKKLNAPYHLGQIRKWSEWKNWIVSNEADSYFSKTVALSTSTETNPTADGLIPAMIKHQVPAKKRFDILSAPNEKKRNEHIEKAARFAFLIAEQEAQRNNGYFPN